MIWIIGLVALVGAHVLFVATSIWLEDRKDKKKRIDNNERLLNRVREVLGSDWHGSQDLRAEIKATTNGRLHELDMELYQQLLEASNQIRAEEERDEQLGRILELHTTYLEAESLADKVCALKATHERLDSLSYDLCREEFRGATGLSKADVAQLIKQLIHQRTTELATEARDSLCPESFHELSVWRHDCRRLNSYSTARYHKFAPSEEWLPDDWNDLVCRYVSNPHLNDFTGVGDLPAGQLRLRAAAALRDQNLTEAKIVLAYCNFDPKLLTEVGDVLTADLAKFVAAEAKRSSENQD